MKVGADMLENFINTYLEVINKLSNKFNVEPIMSIILNVIIFILVWFIICKIFRAIFLSGRGTAGNAGARPSPAANVQTNQLEYFLDYAANSPLQNKYFRFKYIYKGNSWRAYILNNMDYGGRNSDAHSTHRLYDGSLNMHYVCWDRDVKHLDTMTSISKMWADATMAYVSTGKRF